MLEGIGKVIGVFLAFVVLIAGYLWIRTANENLPIEILAFQQKLNSRLPITVADNVELIEVNFGPKHVINFGYRFKNQTTDQFKKTPAYLQLPKQIGTWICTSEASEAIALGTEIGIKVYGRDNVVISDFIFDATTCFDILKHKESST